MKYSVLVLIILLFGCKSKKDQKVIELKKEMANFDTIRSDPKLHQLYQRAVDYLIDQSVNKISLQKSSIRPLIDLIDSLRDEPNKLSQALQNVNSYIKGSYFLDIDSINAKYISNNIYDIIYTLQKAGYKGSIPEELLFEY